RPVRGVSPIFLKVSSTSRAVLTSLNPSSGWRRICSPRPMISSARWSIAWYTCCFSSSLVMSFSPCRRSLRSRPTFYCRRLAGRLHTDGQGNGASPCRRGRRDRRSGPRLLFLRPALVRVGRAFRSPGTGASQDPGSRPGLRASDGRAHDLPHRSGAGCLRRRPGRAHSADHPGRGRLGRAPCRAGGMCLPRGMAGRLRSAGGGGGPPGHRGGGRPWGLAGAARLRWAGRDGGVRARHAFALGGAVYVITVVSFLLVGGRGFAILTHEWLPLLIINVGGVGLFTRLFTDVAGAMAAEAARREAAELRAITLLARPAAHGINHA